MLRKTIIIDNPGGRHIPTYYEYVRSMKYNLMKTDPHKKQNTPLTFIGHTSNCNPLTC